VEEEIKSAISGIQIGWHENFFNRVDGFWQKLLDKAVG